MRYYWRFQECRFQQRQFQGRRFQERQFEERRFQRRQSWQRRFQERPFQEQRYFVDLAQETCARARRIYGCHPEEHEWTTTVYIVHIRNLPICSTCSERGRSSSGNDLYMICPTCDSLHNPMAHNPNLIPTAWKKTEKILEKRRCNEELGVHYSW